MDRIAAANWKMNLPPEGIDAYCRAVRSEQTEALDIVVAPPYPFLLHVRGALGESGALTVAQNCHWELEGAFTGEVSAGMLKSIGVSGTIVGHSERRQHFGEGDDEVARRAVAALESGLVTIFCIGETHQERTAEATEEVLARQLREVARRGDLEDLVIAYEPVWAIGTGLTAERSQIAEAHGFIRGQLGERGEKTRVLYGGSVKPENAEELASIEGVDGFLVGGASLSSESFSKICAALRP